MAIRHIKYGGALVGSDEREAMMRSIDKSIETGNWQQGEEGALLEKEAANFLGLKYGILASSGSCAGLLALSALELPKGGEVIISAVTFPTIFNIILQCGLVPMVVDAKVGNYNFDVKEVERAITPKTRAIIAIHAVGNPCDMPALMRMVRKVNKTRSKQNKIYVIEDNCDGWGSAIKGKKIGSFGDVSITSFHAAHIVSMGIGGGIFTNNRRIAENVRMYRDWGRQANTKKPNQYKTLPKDYNPRFIYEKIGYNFQVLELQAAKGRVQLRKADRIKAMRKKNFDFLRTHLARYDLVMPRSVKDADVCWFSFPITVGLKTDRGELVKHLEKHGIETRSMFAGNITKHPAYKDVKFRIGPDGLEEADMILKRSLWISCHPRLTWEDKYYIEHVFAKFFDGKSR